MKADKIERTGSVEELRDEMNACALHATSKPIPKPASVLYEEFSQKLVDLINRCGLPNFCIIPVIDDVLRQLRAAAAVEYQRDFERWQEKLKKTPPAEGEKTEDET